MTKEKALKTLMLARNVIANDWKQPIGTPEALDMAIEALQAEPTHGRLIDVDELIKKYATCADIDCDTCPIWECGCDGLLQILKEAPIIKDANGGDNK